MKWSNGVHLMNGYVHADSGNAQHKFIFCTANFISQMRRGLPPSPPPKHLPYLQHTNDLPDTLFSGFCFCFCTRRDFPIEKSTVRRTREIAFCCVCGSCMVRICERQFPKYVSILLSMRLLAYVWPWPWYQMYAKTITVKQ